MRERERAQVLEMTPCSFLLTLFFTLCEQKLARPRSLDGG